ncbi:hypothetical protein HN873_009168 [Arachis hypogaea]
MDCVGNEWLCVYGLDIFRNKREQRTLAPPVSRSPAATATPGATGGPAVTAAPAVPLRCNRETLLRWEAPSPRCLDKTAIVSDAESKIDYFPDPWRLHCDTS